MDWARSFADIFGVEGPYGQFQIEPARQLLAGRNVILQAPTGSGKTRAALFPYLLARKEGIAFPRKLLYCVPMRVLARSFGEELRKDTGFDGLDIRLQTGEQQEDRRFEGDITFATIDQVLSSFLFSPYSLPRRLSNLNAGGIAASYLVLDEFHLFDPISTLPTALEMLRTLRGVAPFLLMTATFSTAMLQGLAEALDAVIVPQDELGYQSMLDIPPQRKTRRYHLATGPLCAETVLAHHRHRTLVVCNVVERTQALFESLRNHPNRGDTEVRLLHSRFLSHDRRRIEGEILRYFGKDGERGGSWIVVATQVIEVGLDLTCESLHTELAPANAILQRAGRCARYQGETGDVYIYPVSESEGQLVDLVEKVAPYRELKEEIGRTSAAFGSRSGVLNYDEELQIVSAAHGASDRRTVEGLVATREVHRRRMNDVLDGQRSAEAGNLIRAVSSRQVVVHDDPLSLLERPFAAESFALHSGSLYGLVKKWLARERELDLDGWGVQALHDRGDAEESGASAYGWLPVRDPADVSGAVLVLVHPLLAGYDRDLGFVADRPTGYRAAVATAETAETPSGYAYHLEHYLEHSRQVYRAVTAHAWPELASAAERLEKAFGWPAGIMERAAHLVAILHDVGKLNCKWQDWVIRYQQAIGRPAARGFYAHTDYDPADARHREVQETLGRKPPHAVEGAMAVAPLLVAALDRCEPLFNAAFTAITRHHGAFTRQGQPYALAAGAEQAVAETLALLPPRIAGVLAVQDLLTTGDPAEGEIRDCIVDPADNGQLLAYGLLARALRRADQAGTARGTT